MPRTSAPSNATPTEAQARAGLVLLVVDPDGQAGDLAAELAHNHVTVVVFADPAAALLQAGGLRPDAVLTAARLDGIDSATLVRALAEYSAIPVVVGAGDGDGGPATAALSAGAKACVARPYRPAEVLPILRAIRPDTAVAMDPPLRVGGLLLNPASLEVRLHGRPVRLPMREFRLLQMLMLHADRVVSRDRIRAEVWPDSVVDTTSTITVHIQRLRSRLAHDPHHPAIIRTVRGLGYRLIPPANHS